MSEKTEKNKFSLPVGAVSEENEADFLGISIGERDIAREEAKLAVDVFETKTELIIAAAVAGTPPDKLEIHLHNDLLTIRGERPSPVPLNAEPFMEECYWGKFSRSIVLPSEVKAELAQAQYRRGVLVIKMPKIKTDASIPVFVVEE